MPSSSHFQNLDEHIIVTGATTGKIGDQYNITLKAAKGYEMEDINITGIFEDGENIIECKDYKVNKNKVEYAIRYDNLNGAENHKNNPSSYTIDCEIVLKNPTEKKGYDFTGWSNGGKISKGSTGDKTFTANWKIKEYNVTYELNGGRNNFLNPKTYTIEDEIILKDPTRNGYEFTGWSDGNKINKGSTENKTFTANWEKIKYKISYDNKVINNENKQHFPTKSEELTINEDGKVSMTLPIPKKDGYEFEGWYDEHNRKIKENPVIINKNNLGDKTFIAHWEIKKYNITYELNGGRNNFLNPKTYTIEDEITFKNPTRNGYKFTGWNKGGKINKGSIGNKTFTANWETESYAITYELNGGTNHKDNPITYTSEDSVTLKNPTRNGYKFTGWDNGGRIYGNSIGKKTFTAHWGLQIYNIKYNLNGGSDHFVNPRTYTTEDQVTLQNPTKKGYTFIGWSEGSKIEKGSTGDKTFTANWIPKTYPIAVKVRKDNQITDFSKYGSVTIGGKPYDKNKKYNYDSIQNIQFVAKTGYICNANIKNYTINEENTVIFDIGLKQYSIKYFPDKAFGNWNNNGNPSTFTIEDNINLKIPSKNGLYFNGWIEDGYGSDLKITYGWKRGQRTGDVTVTAIFAETVPVKVVDTWANYGWKSGETLNTFTINVKPGITINESTVKKYLDKITYQNDTATNAVYGKAYGYTGKAEKYGSAITVKANQENKYYRYYRRDMTGGVVGSCHIHGINTFKNESAYGEVYRNNKKVCGNISIDENGGLHRGDIPSDYKRMYHDDYAVVRNIHLNDKYVKWIAEKKWERYTDNCIKDTNDNTYHTRHFMPVGWGYSCYIGNITDTNRTPVSGGKGLSFAEYDNTGHWCNTGEKISLGFYEYTGKGDLSQWTKTTDDKGESCWYHEGSDFTWYGGMIVRHKWTNNYKDILAKNSKAWGKNFKIYNGKHEKERYHCNHDAYAFIYNDQYTIQFDVNSGTGNVNSISANCGEKVKLPSETPTMNGLKFKGWSTQRKYIGEEPDFRAEQTINSSNLGNPSKSSTITLYAVYGK